MVAHGPASFPHIPEPSRVHPFPGMLTDLSPLPSTAYLTAFCFHSVYISEGITSLLREIAVKTPAPPSTGSQRALVG